MRVPVVTTPVTDPGRTPGVAPVGPLPPGVPAPADATDRALYDAAKEFEAVFVRQMVGTMLASARGDGAAEGAEAAYQDMADETMTRSLVEGGSFGLAGTLYGFLRGEGNRS